MVGRTEGGTQRMKRKGRRLTGRGGAMRSRRAVDSGNRTASYSVKTGGVTVRLPPTHYSSLRSIDRRSMCIRVCAAIRRFRYQRTPLLRRSIPCDSCSRTAVHVRDTSLFPHGISVCIGMVSVTFQNGYCTISSECYVITLSVYLVESH